jgi:hypothetical protein
MRKLPNSELVISEVGLGTGTFGGDMTQTDSDAMMDLAFKECGINFVVSRICFYLFSFLYWFSFHRIRASFILFHI